jgi:DNA-binding transcriptional LysR family regulator
VNREPLDLRRLRQFTVVADLGGFSSAASQLHLTQQALSSAIARLEEEVGQVLFERTTRRVRLTPAGEALRAGADALLAASDALLRQVVTTATGDSRPFVVGHSPAISGAEVHRLLAPVRAGLPDQPVTVTQVFPAELESGLLSGRLDVSLRRGVVTPGQFAATVIAYSPVRVAVRAGHRLAEPASVRVSDLRHETIAVWAPLGASFYTDFIVSTCRRAGFEPNIVVNRVQGTPPATAVLDNDAVAFVTDAPGELFEGEVVVREFEDAPMVPVQAVWLPGTVSRARALLTET